MSFLWQIKDEVNRYWGVGALGVLFLCFCLFFLLDKEKNRAMKVYLCYAGFVVLEIANPVSLYVLEKTNNMGVFERLFWLFLSPVILALGFAYVSGKKKGALIAGVLLIVLCGRIVFTDTEYKPATHAYKIDAQAIEVSDAIIRHYEGLSPDEEVIANRLSYEGPRAMITDPLCEGVRMYNANIQLLYARRGFGSYNSSKYKKVAGMLSLENEELKLSYIIKRMKNLRFDYLVVGDWQQFVGDPLKYPLTQIAETANYKVYYLDRNYVKPGRWRVTQYRDPKKLQAMCYTVESSDGGLIVIDGGRAWNSLKLVNIIKDKGGKVDYWIITHPHDDHAGVLASVLEAAWDKNEIEIGQILIGEMDEEAVMAQGGERTDFYQYLMGNLRQRENVTYLKAGDSLDVLGLKMDVLHTCNDTVIEYSDNILNDGSMVFKLSAKKKSFLFLGDIGDNARDTAAKWESTGGIPEASTRIAQEIMEQYGDLLPSTYVQMAHHGNSTLPDEFYETIHPKRAYFDAPKWLMENKDSKTGEPSYYRTPHYVELMQRLGAKIYRLKKNPHRVLLK